MTLPTFKYNPDPISLNVIKKEYTTCPVCEKEREYVYHGPFYSVEDVETHLQNARLLRMAAEILVKPLRRFLRDCPISRVERD